MPINRVLTDRDRQELAPVMFEMQQMWPEMYARKIPDSMVQFAFCYDTAHDITKQMYHTPFVLSAGSHEDIATECLKFNRCCVIGVDPVLNCDLHTFSVRCSDKFDVIVSASVLEHVENDSEFIADCCFLLKPDGYGIFTMDFKNDWQPGQRVPTTSRRFYTVDRLKQLEQVINQHSCYLVDGSDYSAVDRFNWEGIDYSFATFVFQKRI